jgi:transcriptional regulator with XRE-family HTH domain
MKKIKAKPVELTPEVIAFMEAAKAKSIAYEAEVASRTTPIDEKLAQFQLDLADVVDLILREKETLNQREISKRTGMSEPAVSRLLSGEHNPTLRTLAALSVALGEDIFLTALTAQANERVRSYSEAESNDETILIEGIRMCIHKSVDRELTELIRSITGEKSQPSESISWDKTLILNNSEAIYA